MKISVPYHEDFESNLISLDNLSRYRTLNFTVEPLILRSENLTEATLLDSLVDQLARLGIQEVVRRLENHNI